MKLEIKLDEETEKKLKALATLREKTASEIAEKLIQESIQSFLSS